MAQYYFSRDVKVYAHVPMSSAGTPSMFYELPVLDGFSFSQATNASEITLNQAQAESDGASIRGRQMFNDSYAPAEWSFSTYMAPYISGTGNAQGVAGAGTTNAEQCEVSEALWAMFFAKTVATGISARTSSLVTISPSNSNSATIGVFDLYFVFGASKVSATSTSDSTPGASYINASGTNQMIYKIANCSVNEASIDFDLDGIATVNWSGMGKLITEETALNLFDGDYAAKLINEGVNNTTGFIRNRVSDLTISGDSTGSSVDYAVTLTGGNITMSNNLTYLTPETLGVINQPLGHVTGTRSISGNLTCYLDNESNASAELFEDIITATTDIQNVHSLSFDIGASGTPHLILTMATCHLEVPTHAIDDVISLEANFHALPSTIGGTNEITTFNFIGKAVNA